MADINAAPKNPITEGELLQVQAFLYLEARYADESRYEDWEALWTDDGTYWVPVGGDNPEPDRHVSIINDNRARIASRIKQLRTGLRYAQVPVSSMRRLLTNIEVERAGPDELRASCNFMLLEVPLQTTGRQRVWGGRMIYHLRPCDGGLKMSHKRVLLVDRDAAIPNLSFLI